MIVSPWSQKNISIKFYHRGQYGVWGSKEKYTSCLKEIVFPTCKTLKLRGSWNTEIIFFNFVWVYIERYEILGYKTENFKDVCNIRLKEKYTPIHKALEVRKHRIFRTFIYLFFFPCFTPSLSLLLCERQFSVLKRQTFGWNPCSAM